MIAGAAGVAANEVSDERLCEFKSAVVDVLTPYATAVLLDPEYGLEASRLRAPGCGLLLAYEADGYDNPRPHRMLALTPDFPVDRLRALGAHGIKILLSYTPFEDAAANALKCELVERIGRECEALDMPFFLEPVGYDPGGLDVSGFEYAIKKPEIVARSIKEFSKDRYKVDILKVEFPVNTALVGQAYTREAALDHFRRADAAAGRPYIYLSAGVSRAQFTASLELALEAGARFSGVLCGRATWQDGVPVYAGEGATGLRRWLRDDGIRNIEGINQYLRHATPWPKMV